MKQIKVIITANITEKNFKTKEIQDIIEGIKADIQNPDNINDKFQNFTANITIT